MTFSQAYRLNGPDTFAISRALGIEEHEADTLINDHMNKLYERLSRLRARHQDIRKQFRQAEATA